MGIKIEIDGTDLDEIAIHVQELYEAFSDNDKEDATPATATAATPAPATAATPAAAAGTVPVPGSVDLDVDGQPWNEEIHSSAATKKKNGQWTVKRGADKARIAAIYAAHTAAAALAATPAAATPAAVATPAVDPLAAAVAPALPPTTGEDPIAACIRTASEIITTGGQDPAAVAGVSQRINAVMGKHGLVGTPQLTQNPQLAPAVLIDLQVLARECGIAC